MKHNDMAALCGANDNADEQKPSLRIFSGMQASGQLHLGNYLGALKSFVKLQADPRFDSKLYSIVDLHALTVNPEPAKLRASRYEVTAAYLAAGLDSEKNIIFNQARVPYHSELAWIFNCVARMGWLQRMTQFKDKAGKDREKASVGLFAYPTLMAADILLYKATHIPVGEDQKQHIELTRDIAQKFNNDYYSEIQKLKLSDKENRYFPNSEPLFTAKATRIMSLRDASKKMSKSDSSDFSRINLTDNADLIAQKIRKAKTDPLALPDNMKELSERPEAQNLLNIYSALSELPIEATIENFAGKQFSFLKSELIELATAELGPITHNLSNLLKDLSYIDSILAKGAERAALIAEQTIKEVKAIIGLS